MRDRKNFVKKIKIPFNIKFEWFIYGVFFSVLELSTFLIYSWKVGLSIGVLILVCLVILDRFD